MEFHQYEWKSIDASAVGAVVVRGRGGLDLTGHAGRPAEHRSATVLVADVAVPVGPSAHRSGLMHPVTPVPAVVATVRLDCREAEAADDDPGERRGDQGSQPERTVAVGAAQGAEALTEAAASGRDRRSESVTNRCRCGCGCGCGCGGERGVPRRCCGRSRVAGSYGLGLVVVAHASIVGLEPVRVL